MKKILLAVMAGLMLDGCDQTKDVMDDTIVQIYRNCVFEQPSIAISPGWQIDDHGQLSEVYGYSECPKSFLSSVSTSGCVIIDPKDKTVPVFISYGEAPHKTVKNELWTGASRRIPTRFNSTKAPGQLLCDPVAKSPIEQSAG
ncbi:hypothetical protein [Photorhabdus sp. RM96S]|uniref:hypothetical protein n=1 Tax=Photorhabdus sp. RM96S TaxID=3342822 RepID=UPI0036DA9F9C